MIGISSTRHPTQQRGIKLAFLRLGSARCRLRARRSPFNSDFLTLALSVLFLSLALSSASAQTWNSVQRYTAAFLGANTGDLPFSFSCNGFSSRVFLPLWNRTIQIQTLDAQRQKATW